MIYLKIKPLSLNLAYRGRRFKTPALESFKKEIDALAPFATIPEGKLKVKYIFAISSKNSDGDNLIKCFQDGLADKYGFNDKKIYKWDIEKIDVCKGDEYIEYSIESYETNL